MSKIVNAKDKLICPYCSGKQEYPARDFFLLHAEDWYVSEDIQCDHCDKKFHAILLNNKTKVASISNMLSYRGVQDFFGYEEHLKKQQEENSKKG